MFGFQSLGDLETLGPNDGDETAQKWKAWASSELQLRALLGHYILDGQLSFISGEPTSVVHASNSLLLSSSRRLFDCQTANEWLQEMKQVSRGKASFRQIYLVLFKSQYLDDATSRADLLKTLESPMDVRVVLECLHSLVRENRDPSYSQSIVANPSPQEIKLALFRLYEHLERQESSQDPILRLELLLWWHFVCLDFVADCMKLSQQLVREFQIQTQTSIFAVRETQEPWPTMINWTRTSLDARRALLHALAIQDLASQLPLSHIQSMWMPLPVFAAAITLNAFFASGISTVTAPASVNVDWGIVLEARRSTAEPYDTGSLGGDRGRRDMEAFLASSVRATNSSIGPSRSLRYELNSLQTIMHCLSVQWGVCSVLERVLQELKSQHP
jgi:hypothetical protein